MSVGSDEKRWPASFAGLKNRFVEVWIVACRLLKETCHE